MYDIINEYNRASTVVSIALFAIKFKTQSDSVPLVSPAPIRRPWHQSMVVESLPSEKGPETGLCSI